MDTKFCFNDFMKFLIWVQGIIGIFYMYKCIQYPEISVTMCAIAGITIVAIVLCSSLLLTDSLNQFYYDIAELDQSVKNLNSTIKERRVT